MRRIPLALVTTLAFLWNVSSVQACINDHDTLRHERQFKALYPDAPSPAPQAEPEGSRVLAYGGSGLGLALLVAAGYVGLVRSRP